MLAFNNQDLTTQSKFFFNDNISGQITTAHPHYHYTRQELINYTISLSLKSYYNIYRMRVGDQQRQLICKIPVKNPGYMHSFAITDRYTILVEFPLLLHLSQLLFTHKTFIERYQWQPEQGMKFFIVDNQQNKLVATLIGEPCFAFHHINAFEVNNDEIILDLAEHADASIIKALYLSQLQDIPITKLLRYRLNLLNKKVTREVLANVGLELPRINYQTANTKPYQYCYAAAASSSKTFLNQLIKIHTNTAEIKIWQEDNCYPGEPVFVAVPQANKEDDGIVLAVILNAKAQHSFLLILDAGSFQEIARAEIPHIIPLGFHGGFFSN